MNKRLFGSLFIAGVLAVLLFGASALVSGGSSQASEQVVTSANVPAAQEKVAGQVDRYNSPAGVWATIAPLPVVTLTPTPGTAPLKLKRANAAAYHPNGKIYVMGGRRGVDGEDYPLTSILEYTPGEPGTWAQKSAQLDPGLVGSRFTANMAVATLTDTNGVRIYAIGGSSTDSLITSTVRVYNPLLDSVSALASDPWPASPARIPGGWAVYDNKLYIFGGFSAIGSGGVFNETWRFDPLGAPGAKWTELTSADLPVPKGYTAGALLDGYIYAIGGDSWTTSPRSLVPLTDVVRMDPSQPNPTWTTLASLPTARGDMGAWAYDTGTPYEIAGRVAVAGGVYLVPDNLGYIYHPGTNTWSAFPNLVIATRNYGYAQLNGYLYTFGGYDFRNNLPDGANFNHRYDARGPGPSPTVTVTGTPPTATLTATAPTATRTSTAPPATATPCSGGAVLTGSLDAGDPDFTRPNTFQQGGTCTTNGVHNYDVYTLQTSGGQVTASTCGGASWDTYLIIYQAPGGAPIPGFVPSGCTNAIAANDDACGLQSTVTANLAAGTYYVVVSEFSTPGGAYTVNVTAPGACGTPGTATSTRTMTVGVATATASATCVPAGSIVDVSISGFAYSPQNVTIGVGTSVRWTNTDAAAHTSTSNTGVWDSGSMGQGAQYSFTFTTPGTYPYHCTFHPSMTGTITVQAAVPCATNTVVATSTSTRTNTTVPASSTATSALPSSTATTPPATAQPTSTVCTISFSDVLPGDEFYPFIRCLACRGIVSGYSDGTFRPFANMTRGQMTKMVSNAAGIGDAVSGQRYTDVPTSHPFYLWIMRLTARGHVGGYSNIAECPTGVPCFRSEQNVTRGQLAKVASNAAGIQDPVPAGQQTYTDVLPNSTFWVYIERLTARGVMGGYPCGSPDEPCDAQNRPYFRPGNDITRAQASKIVANTFFPGCQTPQR